MHPRSLTWKLNWYRQSELEGALLLGKMVRAVDSGRLITLLTRHCADEAKHACLWADALSRLDLPAVRILRSYQSFYAERGAVPADIAEVLALTHVFERRVWRQFQKELNEPDFPTPVRDTLQILLNDERQHLDWVAEWLRDRPEAAGLIERFSRIDDEVYAYLEPFDK